MERGNQYYDKNVIFTVEVSSAKIAWRDLCSENVSFDGNLFPCSMGSIILSSENDEKWPKSLTPLHFRAFQVRELTISKSRGENVLFQGFIFCYWSAVKCIFPKWATNQQDNEFRTVHFTADAQQNLKMLKKCIHKITLIKIYPGDPTQKTSAPPTIEKQHLTAILQ